MDTEASQLDEIHSAVHRPASALMRLRRVCRAALTCLACFVLNWCPSDLHWNAHLGKGTATGTQSDCGLVSCSEEHIATVVRKALQEASVPSAGLSYEDFDHVLKGSPLHMQVDVPMDA